MNQIARSCKTHEIKNVFLIEKDLSRGMMMHEDTSSLTEKDGTIAGIWYARPSELPEFTSIEDIDLANILIENSEKVHTGGIRLYPNARGK
jgi:hypothetical protein